jgi:hypothetical protein
VEQELNFPSSQGELLKVGGADFDDLDDLPPLKPKFGSDDDEEFENVFLRSSQSHKSTIGKTSSPVSNGASHASSSGIKFSMKKKQVTFMLSHFLNSLVESHLNL